MKVRTIDAAQVSSYVRKELEHHHIPRGSYFEELERRISGWYEDWFHVSAGFIPFGTGDLPEQVQPEVNRLMQVFADRMIGNMTRSAVEMITLMVLDQEAMKRELLG